ncbi:hypothetical protein AAFF_G00082440 [Aldrovandia affinis]|uniref:Uncharacterized protein n=1 Tax=Aldrovandia affinis TaxID=143900 RepID=A0AAD7T4S2_9TELE|nr:hypothetical protein AAFF_G00082440 [Aldrovandia affinis]
MESTDLKALIAQLVVSSQQQQARHEEAMRVQIQSVEEQRRQHAQAMEVQIQNMELLRAELRERIETQEEHALAERVRRANPAKFLVKQTPTDDIETFLRTFERTAERKEWPEEHWVGLIAPFLSGIA